MDQFKNKTKIYETDELIVYWKPWKCQHAKECIKGSPKVFDSKRRPWVILEYGDTDQIIETIEKCPSHALSYKRK